MSTGKQPNIDLTDCFTPFPSGLLVAIDNISGFEGAVQELNNEHPF
jgi:hypothetical protein